jgi:excinuclease ABC subunit B
MNITKNIIDINDKLKAVTGSMTGMDVNKLTKTQATEMINDLNKEMKLLAKGLEFEKAALIRDQINDIRNLILDDSAKGLKEFLGTY